METEYTSGQGGGSMIPGYIREYYGARASQEIVSWENSTNWNECGPVDSWLAIRFPGTIHRWYRGERTNWYWTLPGSEGCKLFVFDRFIWDGITEKPIQNGVYMTWAWSMEEAMDAMLRAFDPFYAGS